MNQTVFATVVTGLVIFVLGQILLKLFIEPMQEMRKTIGLVAHALKGRAAVIHNPTVSNTDELKEVSRDLRDFSAKLYSHLYAVPFYRVASRLFLLPTKKCVLTAVRELGGLSNNLTSQNPSIHQVNAGHVQRISESLGLFMPENERWPDEPRHN
jgi:hypothetical protein